MNKRDVQFHVALTTKIFLQELKMGGQKVKLSIQEKESSGKKSQSPKFKEETQE